MAGGVIGGILGGVVGFFIGGPTGAYLGASIGAGLGLGLTAESVSPTATDGAPQNNNTTMAAEGATLADLVGTSKIAGDIIWVGSSRAVLVRAASSGGKKGGGKGGSKSVAPSSEYHYYKSWAVGICQGPIDALFTIWNEDECVWYGQLTRPVGGVSTITLSGMGTCRFYFGTTDQGLEGSMPGAGPNYRRVCYAFMDDCLLGSVDRVPSLRFVVGKFPLYDNLPGAPTINGYDYNPAHALYHVMVKGLGLPAEYMDIATFVAAAETLEAETLGVSILFDSSKEAQAYLTDVLDHIGGLIRYDFSGRFSVRLMRRGAAVEDLPRLDESMIVEEPTIERSGYTETINCIKISYPLRIETVV